MVVDNGDDVLFFQRKKSWCSCANFLGYFALRFFSVTSIWFSLAFVVPVFFRRVYLYEVVSVVELTLFVYAVIVDSMDFVGKGGKFVCFDDRLIIVYG